MVPYMIMPPCMYGFHANCLAFTKFLRTKVRVKSKIYAFPHTLLKVWGGGGVRPRAPMPLNCISCILMLLFDVHFCIWLIKVVSQRKYEVTVSKQAYFKSCLLFSPLYHIRSYLNSDDFKGENLSLSCFLRHLYMYTIK